MVATSPSNSSSVPHLQSVLKSFNFYGTVFILLPGLVLNLFTFSIFFTRKRFYIHTKMGYYYSVSSATSSVTMIVGMLTFFPSHFDKDLNTLNDWSCKLIWQARTQVILFSGYFTVLITLDRTLSCLYPNQYSFFRKTRNLVTLTLAIHAFVFVTNLFQWTRRVKITPIVFHNGRIEVKTCTLCGFWMYVFSFEAILGRLVPCLANSVMNVILIRKLVVSKRQFIVYSGSLRHFVRSKEYYFAYSVIGMNFAFFVLTFPHVLLSLFNIYVKVNGDQDELAALASIAFTFGAWGNYM